MQAGMLKMARWAVVLLIVLGLPLLAIPGVTRTVSSLLYGASGEHLPVLEPTSSGEPAVVLHASEEHARMNFEQPTESPIPSVYRSQLVGSDVTTIPGNVSLPPDEITFDQAPAGLPRQLPLPLMAPATKTVDWEQRVSAVRLQLERWGADYLLLEAIGSDNYQFHCRMAAPGGEKRTFEVMARDPANAAEQVLDEVAVWKATLNRKR